MSKVARVTFTFWIIKICATTLGETGGDLLSMTMNVGYAISSLILLSLFLVTLTVQLLSRRFHPLIYWSVILTTSTAGTTVSDYMDRSLGLGYAKGSLMLFAGLLTVLAVWRLLEGSLSVNNVRSTRVEILYWAAILFSNTLGTALGDYLADDSGLGFLGGASLIGGLILAVSIASFSSRANRVLLFWVAFVLTRPFGATFGDLLTKAPAEGGLGFGTLASSLVLALPLVGFVLHDSLRLRRQDRLEAAAAEAAANDEAATGGAEAGPEG